MAIPIERMDLAVDADEIAPQVHQGPAGMAGIVAASVWMKSS
jgi:hypothetical protein